MKKINLTLRRLTLLLIVTMTATSISWAGNFDTPQAFNETDDGSVTSMIMRGHEQSFNLKPMIVGDVDMNGAMTIDDVTALIDALLTGYYSGNNGDVNGDGRISIDDVTDLIDRLLAGNVETRLSTIELANAMNSIYKKIRTVGWSTTGNYHQCFGISAYTLAAEVMGDDMIMGASGSGWFWFDASYSVKERYTSTSWRSYDLWTAYYTYIAEANSIIAQKDEITGDANLVDYYVGQAHALRAYSYFMLAQWFARTYVGHQSDPCVPLFTGHEFTNSTGQPRATVAQVYAQIDTDINIALNLLNGKTQLKREHIGYAVALGLQARIALVKEDWDTAYESAQQAKTASGKSIQEVSAFAGLNDATAGNVMWGAQISEQEVGQYASLWAHMDPSKPYAQRSPKLISPWLYSKMSSTDARLAWWRPNDTGAGPEGNISQKFTVKEGTEWGGDYIYMRVEEMYLIAAEAACRRNQTTRAKANLTSLMQKRDPNYTCTKTGTSLGDLTTNETGSLLEEILIQRRLELWGEDGRIFTIRRLHQGFERPASDGWPSNLQLSDRSLQDPESYPWVMTIQLSEFTNNANMNINYDQNPLGDYPDDSEMATSEQNVSFSQAEYHVTTAASTLSYKIQLTRSTSRGKYIVPIQVTNSHGLGANSFVTFNDGQNTAEATITGNYLELGHTYSCTLSLSPYDINNGSLSGRITSTDVEVKCENGDPTGQHISFDAASYEGISHGYDCSVWVTLTRRVSQGEYRAVVTKEDASSNINFVGDNILFRDGELTTTVEVYCHNMTAFDTYSCVLKLSDADIATAIPGQPQITSTTVTFKGEMADEWENAGSCTFTDFTWEENGYTALNVPILKKKGTNTYCIYSPLAYVYNSSYGYGMGDTANWEFYLNGDGSITVPEGTSINYWGYLAFWTNSYPDYCYVTQDGNTYDVHFLLEGPDQYYQGGHFVFTWNR